jgi:hypothetical protein
MIEDEDFYYFDSENVYEAYKERYYFSGAWSDIGWYMVKEYGVECDGSTKYELTHITDALQSMVDKRDKLITLIDKIEEEFCIEKEITS